MKIKKSKLIFPITIAMLLTGCSMVFFPYKEVDKNDDPSDYNDPTIDLLSAPLTEIEGANDYALPTDVIACEDSYVLDGSSKGNDSVGNNYGNSDSLAVKKVTSGNTMGRYAYLKFDLNELEDKNFIQASLVLYCSSIEVTSGVNLTVNEVNSSWNESDITFSNKPTLGDVVTSATLYGTGTISLDITSYLQSKIDDKTTFSFGLQNVDTKARKMIFSSKESEEHKPMIQLRYSEVSFNTNLNLRNQDTDPWLYGVRMVNTWLKHREKINQHVAPNDISLADPIDKEYPLTVGAAKANATDGNNTVYTNYKTRILSSLQDYTYNNNETAKYDKYGGYTGGVQFAATGYYYIKKYNGRYWNVDPLGYPFYRVGINTVSEGDSYVKEAYRSKWKTSTEWCNGETKILTDDLGFNTCGAWSSYKLLLLGDDPMAQNPIISFMSNYGKITGGNNTTGGSTTFVNGVMPVFDPNFETYCDSRAREIVLPYANNKNIFGWFMDNELEASSNMLIDFISTPTDNQSFNYTYATAWTYLYARLRKLNITINDITNEMKEDFRAMVYDRYFDVCSNAVRKYDKNHLLEGCRYLRKLFEYEYPMKVAGYYNDVISVNTYNTWTPSTSKTGENFVDMYNWSGKPIIITEWYAKGMDACTEDSQLTNKSGAGWTVKTQKDRGYFYQNFVLRLLECKCVCGFDYFKMWDNNPYVGGADSSNINSNKGIYNIHHELYTDFTDLISELNKNTYTLINYFDNK